MARTTAPDRPKSAPTPAVRSADELQMAVWRALSEIRAVLLPFTDDESTALWEDGTKDHCLSEFGLGLLASAADSVHRTQCALYALEDSRAHPREYNAGTDRVWDRVTQTKGLAFLVHETLAAIHLGHRTDVGPLPQASSWLASIVEVVDFHLCAETEKEAAHV